MCYLILICEEVSELQGVTKVFLHLNKSHNVSYGVNKQGV